ncbi:glycine zipper 2TM domain-containing protein [Paraburkholderia sp. GAS42]|uniref:glycine zipper 2TM domain-containing protein n=1 Tax=Paraburkholderia sp. GAS42 TaxID=3035135 RepID=UPI003D24B67F
MDNPNTQPTQKSRLHPLVATAAGAVIIAALAATAAVTGVFPKAGGNNAQTDQSQAAQVGTQPPVVDSAQPANPANYAQQPQQQQAVQQQQAQAQQQPAPQAPPAPAPTQQPQYAQQPAQQAPAQPAYCQSCGTVEAISAVKTEGHGTGIGAVGGAVAGGVVGNQFGSGNGRTAMTVLGALGGGLAGNSVEKHLRSTTSYSVRVRMENGKTRYFTYHDAPPFQQGQRVRVENGTLVAG